MRRNLGRLAMASVASLAITASFVGMTAAATPDSQRSVDNVIREGYFDCDGVPIDAVWTIKHHLTYFFNKAGDPVRDIEKIEWSGVFLNTANGMSIADSGHLIFQDTLAPDYSFLTTTVNVLRRSAYLHVSGREDFQTGKKTGVDNWDSGIAAACEALGA